MGEWTHPLEPPIVKWLPTAATLAIILLVLQLEPVRIMEYGALLHLFVNVSITFSTLYDCITNKTNPSLMYTVICPTIPRPVNGRPNTYSDPTIPRDEGSTVTYSCNTGYELVGNSVRTCTSSGWNGSSPLCRGTGSLHASYMYRVKAPLFLSYLP